MCGFCRAKYLPELLNNAAGLSATVSVCIYVTPSVLCGKYDQLNSMRKNLPKMKMEMEI